MSKLNFSDGVTFDTSGAYRVEWRKDGYYVVGHGFLCPVESHQAGRILIEELQNIKNK